jgi:hypothetical protein
MTDDEALKKYETALGLFSFKYFDVVLSAHRTANSLRAEGYEP